MVTQNDILEEVVGDLDMEDKEPIQRGDGSWLVDGQHSIWDMDKLVPNFKIPEDEAGDYNTLAGFILARLGRIPKAADSLEWENYRIEVIDMDGKRIDKVLIARKADSA
jgi:putative hemolysin